jgi:putative ABC transport system permease protein
VRRHRHLDNLDQEIQDHLAAETQDNIDRGMSAVEARTAALRKFGSVSRVREETYNVWHPEWIAQSLQDLRYALRALLRNRGFACAVILTLGIAIGMNTAVFSVVEASLLRPLRYPDADRLVWLAAFDRFYQPGNDIHVGRSEYAIWSARNHAFEGAAAYGNEDLAFIYHAKPSQERVAFITGDFWELTGAKLALGRLFEAGEGQTVVLSNAIFERRFHSDAGVLGQTVTIQGAPFTVVGVLQKDFRFVLPQQFINGDEVRDIDVYIPIPLTILSLPSMPAQTWDNVKQRLGPAPYSLDVIGRLRPGVSLIDARTEMESIRERIDLDHPPSERVYDLHRDWRMEPLQQKLAGNARRSLLVLLAAVGFVLLIACANIANLFIARAAARQREIAVRAAMGAGRMRVIRQFLAESILLALLGGASGLLLARGAIAAMIRLWPQAIPRLAETRIDAPLLTITIALSCLTGVIFGLAPAKLLGRPSLHDVLKGNSQTTSAGAERMRIRQALIAVEFALAIILLTGAGLMVKSFWRMNSNPPGFKPAGILTLRISLAGKQYDDWLAKQAYIMRLFDRVQAFPGVEAVGLDSQALHTTVKVEGLQQVSPDVSFASIRAVSAGYLHAMGVPLIAGHWPTETQMLDDCLVNESFARSVSPTGDVIGRHVAKSFLSATIVGVVADFKYSQLDAEPSPEIYTSYQLAPAANPMTIRLFVRMAGTAQPSAVGLQKLIASLDPTLPVYDVQTLEQALSDSIAPRRFNLFLMGTFAASAVVMSLVGIYGVVSYSVTQRTREIGVRMALGADRGSILGMVMREGMSVSIVGIVAGGVGAEGVTRLMGSLLYHVRPNDPLTFVFVGFMLTATALAACLGPSFRASLVDPILALRNE